jgi:PAS domain S-box-containing protein
MKPRLTERELGTPPVLSAEEVLETIADAFLAVDRNWRITYVNREAERLLEHPREDLLGRDLWVTFPEARGTTFEREYRRAFESQHAVQFEEFYPPLTRWFDVRAYPSDNHLTIYFHDTTERRQAEEAARFIRERLDQLLQSVDVGLWYCDLPFDELVWNDRTKAHFWLPPDARVTIDTFYDRLHPDDRERVRNDIQQAISQQRTYDTEYRTVSPDGRTKWIRAIGGAFYGSNGQPVRFDGVTVDITAEKDLLEQEQQSRAEAEMLNTVGRALSAELDLEKLVQMITNTATELTRAEFGAFFYNVVDDEGESYTLYTLAGTPRESFTKFPCREKRRCLRPHSGAKQWCDPRISPRIRATATILLTTACQRAIYR